MRIPIAKVGMSNVVRDVNPHELPPNMWSSVQNMRFKDGSLEKFTGHVSLATPTVDPYWLLAVPTATQYYWLYASSAKVYEWHAATHTDITRASGGDYTGAYNGWTGGLLNGIPIINSGADVPQMWTPISPSTDLTPLSDWPSGWLCKALRPFKQFLIAMDISKSGTRYPQLVAWSHPADPGSVPASWDSTDDTLDAGENPLAETPGFVVDGATLRDVFMVYKEDSVYVCSFVGGSKVLNFQQLSDRAGILSRNCIAPFVHQGPKHAVFGVDDCFVTNGSSIEYLFNATWKKWLYAKIDATYKDRCFTVADKTNTEVWFCFPETGQTLPNMAVVWNWATNQISARDLPGTPHIAVGSHSITDDSWDNDSQAWDADTTVWDERVFNPSQTKMMMAFPGASRKIFECNNSGQFNSVSFTAQVEREGLTVLRQDRQGNIIEDIEVRKLVAELWPLISAESGTTVTIQVGVQERISDPITWSPEMTFTVGTDDKVNPLIAGRIVSVRFKTTHEKAWKLQAYDLDIRPLGKY